MLSHVDLVRGMYFAMDGAPFEVVEHSHMFKGRGSSVMQTKIKNLRTGAVQSKTFHAGDQVEEAEVQKVAVTFVYENKGKYVFAQADNPSERFEFSQQQIGDDKRFLLPNMVLEGLKFRDEILGVKLPIKVVVRVKDAPPGVKGDRAQSGNKTITLETGAELQAPLFVESGDQIEVNTEKGEYVRRIQKS
ncbi:MAG: elongation factor P [bacterium]|nr:elongation factor P [bacterium]MDZ4231765.1 elongation factor P [Candidatus Pacearchaeota archaeon]